MALVWQFGNVRRLSNPLNLVHRLDCFCCRNSHSLRRFRPREVNAVKFRSSYQH